MNKTLLVCVTALLATPFAFASHAPAGACGGGDHALGITPVSGGSADTTYYVDHRGSTIRIYAESNGIWSGTDPAHDLQRGGTSSMGDETCQDDPDVEPDTLLI